MRRQRYHNVTSSVLYIICEMKLLVYNHFFTVDDVYALGELAVHTYTAYGINSVLA